MKLARLKAYLDKLNVDYIVAGTENDPQIMVEYPALGINIDIYTSDKYIMIDVTDERGMLIKMYQGKNQKTAIYWMIDEELIYERY